MDVDPNSGSHVDHELDHRQLNEVIDDIDKNKELLGQKQNAHDVSQIQSDTIAKISPDHDGSIIDGLPTNQPASQQAKSSHMSAANRAGRNLAKDQLAEENDKKRAFTSEPSGKVLEKKRGSDRSKSLKAVSKHSSAVNQS